MGAVKALLLYCRTPFLRVLRIEYKESAVYCKWRIFVLGNFVGERACVKSNMVYTLCKHMVYMLSITNEHKNELEIRAKPEWKVHFLCFASAKRGSFSIR